MPSLAGAAGEAVDAAALAFLLSQSLAAKEHEHLKKRGGGEEGSERLEAVAQGGRSRSSSWPCATSVKSAHLCRRGGRRSSRRRWTPWRWIGLLSPPQHLLWRGRRKRGGGGQEGRGAVRGDRAGDVVTLHLPMCSRRLSAGPWWWPRLSLTTAVVRATLVCWVFIFRAISLLSSTDPGCSASWPAWTRRTVMLGGFCW